MPQIGVDIITSNSEYAGSQWEINFSPGLGLRGPDTAFTFKNGVKEIAKQDGYLATFMSKPFADGRRGAAATRTSRCCGRRTAANAFSDDDGPTASRRSAATSSAACCGTRSRSMR